MNIGLARSLLILSLSLHLARTQVQDNNDETPRCKKELVESYALNGFMTPRIMNMYVCPTVKNSCCSMYDQFAMFTNWRDKIEPKLAKFYDSIGTKLLTLQTLIREVLTLDFLKMIGNLQIPDRQKEETTALYLRLNQTDVLKTIDDLVAMEKDNSHFMLKLRSSFYCTICDFDSHQYFDVPKKTFTADFSTCSEIALKTINFSYLFTIKLIAYVQDLTRMFMSFALSEAEQPVRVRFYRQVAREVRSCAKVIQMRTGKYTGCKRYCENWRLNANSPVLEGYQVFLNEGIATLSKFYQTHGPKPARVLAAVERLESAKFEVKPDDAAKFLKQVRHPEIFIPADKKHLKERLLNDFNDFYFDPIKAASIKDPYDEANFDETHDEYLLNQMFNFQEEYEEERKHGYAQFIATKMSQMDTSVDAENSSDENVFAVVSNNIVDLENFSTQIKARGFDATAHINQNNLEASMRDLIMHLKTKSKFPVLYEKLDGSMLAQINDINNSDVANFHRDNFILFRDFSPELKKIEMESKLGVD